MASSDVSAATNLFPTANEGFITTIAAPGITAGAATIPLAGVSGLTNGSIFVGIVEPGLTNQQTFTGTVDTAGVQITSVVWTRGTNVSHSTGTTIVDYVSGTGFNLMSKGIRNQHKQSGAHSAVTADSIVVSGTSTLTGNVTIGGSLTIGGTGSGGYDPMSGTVTAVTYNGNRSYDITTSADNTALISPGMRLRTTRTVAAPTQCTSLNGTTQYYSKTSPAATTFTDDFVVSAWVKVTSYLPSVANNIVTRYNGTSGWQLYMEPTGQITFVGRNAGAANFRGLTTYQSLPLGKWVHIAAQLDMSSLTLSATTMYCMIDGADAPASLIQGGTSPTALIQAGNLEIGSTNGGTGPFNGKIAQVAIFNAKITQATMRGYMSQGLSGSETSLISAYSFNNSITDLNTGNANNLTANGSAVATNADSPFGGQAGGTISSSLDYLIAQKVTASTITAQAAEGCTVPTSGGVSAMSYASVRQPFGFPGQSGKWHISSLYMARTTQSSPTSGVSTNLGERLIIPVGEWNAGYKAFPYIATGTTGFKQTATDLSAVLGTVDLKSPFSSGGTYINTATEAGGLTTARYPLTASTATPYYLNIQAGFGGSTLALSFLHDNAAGEVFADNAYL